MLRAKLRKFVSSKKHRPCLLRFFRLMLVICIVWTVSLAFLNRGVFTSENAFRPISAKITFGGGDHVTDHQKFLELKERVKQTFENEFHNNT